MDILNLKIKSYKNINLDEISNHIILEMGSFVKKSFIIKRNNLYIYLHLGNISISNLIKNC